jgi:hypothetical protein
MCSIALTSVMVLGLYVSGLIGLHQAGYLPPPPFVNSLCADEKLEALRERPPQQPTYLIVGSSVAEYNVDSAKIISGNSEARPLNEGFCAAQAHQVAFITRYMIERFPSVHVVIAVLEPHDFRNCSAETEQLFPPQAADDYILHRRWLYGFYLRYFDLHSLQQNLRKRLAERAPEERTDQWGDVQAHEQRSLYYGKFEGYEEACFTALRDMADRLQTGGRQLLVVSSPLNPQWSERYDEDGAVRAAFSGGIRSALAGTDATFWDAEHAFPMNGSQFGDAVHLLWPAAQSFTEALVTQSGLDNSDRMRASR